ncbi:MAG: mechanosensitive ion channel family protein [Rhizobiaceae bacterium]|nr:mechanosensitive ion channel family protein [Rhizobiaceae bacterium]
MELIAILKRNKPNSPNWAISTFLMGALYWALATSVSAQTVVNPLTPPATQSPQDTLFGFISEMESAYRLAGNEDGNASSRLLNRAVKSLDLSQLPPKLAKNTGIEAALMLKEVLDRIQLPALENVPGITEISEAGIGVGAKESYKWVIPGTSIKIKLMSQGERAGEFLFTARTVERAKEFYERVRHLPYREGATPGIYEAYLSTPGDGLELSWSKRFPAWTKHVFSEQTVWQWIGFALTAVAATFAVFKIMQFGLRYDANGSMDDSDEVYGKWRLWSIISIAISLGVITGADLFISDTLNLTGAVHDSVILTFGIVWYGLACWLIYLVAKQIGELVIISQKLRPDDAIGQLIRLFSRLIGLSLVLSVIVFAGQDFGLPAYSIVTGLGVGGIAIGFGAQSLVRDIFSGIFFLSDDAFRIGEYLDIDGTVGTVDKISIRTLRLRHHLGALHIIPYGQINKLTNHSRDWVIVKQKFTVPFDTDVEKVRRIFRAIGQEMYEDNPDYSDNIIEPFKLQGVYKVDDIGIVVRGKFMAKPATQFVIKKDIYARVQKAFEENGIEFARKEVFVKIPGLGNAKNLEPEQKQAIAAAASEAAETPALK